MKAALFCAGAGLVLGLPAADKGYTAGIAPPTLDDAAAPHEGTHEKMPELKKVTEEEENQVDLLRPAFHYTRKHGWTSHPMPYYDDSTGVTHLFYLCAAQSTSEAAPWEKGQERAWCHATARDPAGHWLTHPPALTKEKAKVAAGGSGEPEVGGAGNVLALNEAQRYEMDDTLLRLKLHHAKGARTAIVTGGAVLWVSTDKMLYNWVEVGSLELPDPPEGLYACGDVFTYRHKNAWRLVMSGSRAPDCKADANRPHITPLALVYEGAKLAPHSISPWRYLSLMYEGTEEQGPNMESPSVFLPHTYAAPEYVLVWSGHSSENETSTFWAYGQHNDDGSFNASKTGRWEYGAGFAAQVYAAQGKLMSFSWLRDEPTCTEVDTDYEHKGACKAVHVGAHSLVREVTLSEDGLGETPELHPAEALMSRVALASQTSQAVAVDTDEREGGKEWQLEGMPPEKTPVWLHLAADVEPRLEKSSFGLDLLGHVLQLDLWPGEEGQGVATLRLDEAVAPLVSEVKEPHHNNTAPRAEAVPAAEVGGGADQQAALAAGTKAPASAVRLAGAVKLVDAGEVVPAQQSVVDITKAEQAYEAAQRGKPTFHLRVSLFVDHDLVEAYANNGTVVLTSTDRKRNFTGVMGGRPKAPSEKAEVWVANATAGVRVTWAKVEAQPREGSEFANATEEGTPLVARPRDGKADASLVGHAPYHPTGIIHDARAPALARVASKLYQPSQPSQVPF